MIVTVALLVIVCSFLLGALTGFVWACMAIGSIDRVSTTAVMQDAVAAITGRFRANRQDPFPHNDEVLWLDNMGDQGQDDLFPMHPHDTDDIPY